MQIAVLGSGGIGGYYGALLAKTGHDVVFIARGTHLEALQRQGLTVRTPEGSSTLPVMAVADTSGVGSVDLVLFCVKSYDRACGPRAAAADGTGDRSPHASERCRQRRGDRLRRRPLRA